MRKNPSLSLIFVSRYWISIVTKNVPKFFKNIFASIYTKNLSDNFFFAVTFIGLIIFTLADISTLKYFSSLWFLFRISILVIRNNREVISSVKCNSSQPRFQRQINDFSTLWINVETMLIRLRKWNNIRRRFFNVAQRWYNVRPRHWNNVKTTLRKVETTSKQRCTTLIQRCISVVLTCPQRFWNYIETIRAIDYGFINRLIIFILLSETIFFTTCF